MGNLKDIPHPNWDTLQEYWLNHIPSGLTASSAPVDEILRLSAIKPEDKQEIGLVDGVRERTFSDAIFLRDKALYCYNASSALNFSGYSTWTLLSMYDSCFFAAKSLIYLLGFRDVGRNSSYYMSLFHLYATKGSKKASDGHYTIRLNERLSHDSLWSVFERLIGTLRGDGEGVAFAKLLKKNNYDSFSRDRNYLVYESNSWSRFDDLSTSDLSYPVSYCANVRFLGSAGKDNAEYTDKYYRTAHTVINIVDSILSGLGTYAPEVRSYLEFAPGLPAVAHSKFS